MRLRDQTAVNFEPTFSREDRHLGLELPHFALGLFRLGLGNVGRVGDDEIVCLSRRSGQQVALLKNDAMVQLQPCGICPRDFQGSRRDVHGFHARPGQLRRQRQRDAARTRPHVDDARRLLCTGQFQHGFDYVLGLGTRDQHRRRDDQVHPPEFLMTGDVLRRLAGRSLGDGFVVARLFVGGQLIFGMGVEVGAVGVEHEHQQRLGVHARRADLLSGQEVNCSRKSLPKQHRSLVGGR